MLTYLDRVIHDEHHGGKLEADTSEGGGESGRGHGEGGYGGNAVSTRGRRGRAVGERRWEAREGRGGEGT